MKNRKSIFAIIMVFVIAFAFSLSTYAGDNKFKTYITWLGSYFEQPVDVLPFSMYYNEETGNTYVYDGVVWQPLFAGTGSDVLLDEINTLKLENTQLSMRIESLESAVAILSDRLDSLAPIHEYPSAIGSVFIEEQIIIDMMATFQFGVLIVDSSGAGITGLLPTDFESDTMNLLSITELGNGMYELSAVIDFSGTYDTSLTVRDVRILDTLHVQVNPVLSVSNSRFTTWNSYAYGETITEEFLIADIMDQPVQGLVDLISVVVNGETITDCSVIETETPGVYRLVYPTRFLPEDNVCFSSDWTSIIIDDVTYATRIIYQAHPDWPYRTPDYQGTLYRTETGEFTFTVFLVNIHSQLLSQYSLSDFTFDTAGQGEMTITRFENLGDGAYTFDFNYTAFTSDWSSLYVGLAGFTDQWGLPINFCYYFLEPTP